MSSVNTRLCAKDICIDDYLYAEGGGGGHSTFNTHPHPPLFTISQGPWWIRDITIEHIEGYTFPFRIENLYTNDTYPWNVASLIIIFPLIFVQPLNRRMLE